MTTRLLLVEPSLTTQKVVELAFEEEDVEIAVALTGAEALEQVERVRPSIILASVTLPDMSGIELCRSVREGPQGGDLPVILLVARGEYYDEGEARAAGVIGRLSKPLDSQELVELVEQEAIGAKEPPSASAEGVSAPEHVGPAVVGPPVGGPLASLPTVEEPSPEEDEGSPEPGGAVTDETPAPEVVAAEGAVEAMEDETDFDLSLQSLSEQLRAAEAAAGEPSAVGEVEPPPSGEGDEGREPVLEPRPDEVEAGIVLEKASDDEIRDTLFEGEEVATAFRPVQRPPREAPRERVRGEEPVRARRGPEAEGDLLERLIGRRVRQFTEDIVRDSLKQSLERISPEIITAVRDEVRVLLPDLAERIIRDEVEKLKRELGS